MDINLAFFTTFIFVFGIVYGLLILSDIFGKQKRVLAIIALAFGLFAASYEPLVVFIQTFLPYATGILVVVFFLMFIKLLIFGRGKKEGKGVGVEALLVMLAAVMIFLAAASSSGWLQRYLPSIPYMDMSNMLWAIGLLIAVIIIYIAYDKAEDTPRQQTKSK